MRSILSFPQRGNPPACPEGYTRDPGNPFVFRLSWEPCSHRTETKEGCCNSNRLIPYCSFFELPVTQQVCKKCDAVKFPKNQNGV